MDHNIDYQCGLPVLQKKCPGARKSNYFDLKSGLPGHKKMSIMSPVEPMNMLQGSNESLPKY